VPAGYRQLGSGDDASEANSDDEDDGARGPGEEDSAASGADDCASGADNCTPASVSTVQTAGDRRDAGRVAQARGHAIVPIVPAAFCRRAEVEASCFSAQEAAHIRMAMRAFHLPPPEWARELDVSTHACPWARPMHAAPLQAPCTRTSPALASASNENTCTSYTHAHGTCT
jgi:hypothetical protein